MGCVCIGTCLCGCPKQPEEGIGFLVPELQAFVDCLIEVLGTEVTESFFISSPVWMFEDSHVAQAALEFLSSNGSLSLISRVLGFQAYTIIPSKFIFDVNRKTLKIVVGFCDCLWFCLLVNLLSPGFYCCYWESNCQCNWLPADNLSFSSGGFYKSLCLWCLAFPLHRN